MIRRALRSLIACLETHAHANENKYQLTQGLAMVLKPRKLLLSIS